MRRREFIALVGGAAAWPGLGHAQNPSLPVIGYLGVTTGQGTQHLLDAFERGLNGTGFFKGQNFAFEYRFAERRQEQPAEFAADLVRRRVAIICAPSNVAALAAKAATSDIPIVFVVGLDPVRMGLVSAINRPDGNATGVYFPTSALEPKRFGLLRELLPRVALVAALVNPANPNAEPQIRDLQTAAHTLGLHLVILKAGDVDAIDTAFTNLARQRIGALLVTSDPLFANQRQRLIKLAAHGGIPVIYPWRDFAEAGGLLSYGNSLTDALRQIGLYAGRILKGDKPADLPVWLPSTFELVINLKTARALGLEIPPNILARADEVIE